MLKKNEIVKLLLDYVNANADHLDSIGYDPVVFEEDDEPTDLDDEILNNIRALADEGDKVKVVDGYTVSQEDADYGDGDGAAMWMVVKIDDGKEPTYVKFNGWRSSYDSDSWSEDYEVVEPRMVQVRQWFGVK